MKILNASVLYLTVFLLLTGFAPAKKYVFDSDEGRFSVTFPAEYDTERDEGDDVTTIKISCTSEGQTYFASYSVHQVQMDDPVELAEVSYDSFIQAVGGELITKSAWDVREHSGLKALMDLPESEVKLEYRVVLVGNIQYQLVVMAPYQDYDEKAADKFLSSFKLVD